MTGSSREKCRGNGIVRRNRALDTGAASTHTAYAISAFGDVDIVDNLVSGVSTPNPEGRIFGILANDGGDVGKTFVIRGNIVRDLRPIATQESNAIYTGSIGSVEIRDNVVSGPDAANSFGISCPWLPATRVSGNDLYDFQFPFWGCQDDADSVVRN